MPDDDDDEVFSENPFAGYSPHSPQRYNRDDELLSDADNEPQRGKGRTRAPRGKSRAPATERGWRYMSTHMNDTKFTHALHADTIKHDSLKNSDPFCHKSGCKTPSLGSRRRSTSARSFTRRTVARSGRRWSSLTAGSSSGTPRMCRTYVT
ncbi:hypothetical protein T492DRAFT_913274 [Pavlovales sp. CCMP2436]|nr:hypothetical protein T492DRAFT_913274 [Pavlovales sp. CCMP2436]